MQTAQRAQGWYGTSSSAVASCSPAAANGAASGAQLCLTTTKSAADPLIHQVSAASDRPLHKDTLLFTELKGQPFNNVSVICERVLYLRAFAVTDNLMA